MCLQQLHVRSNNFTCPHRNFVTSGLPTQNRIQQNLWLRPPHKIHDPGGQPTGFEDPCRTLLTSLKVIFFLGPHFSSERQTAMADLQVRSMDESAMDICAICLSPIGEEREQSDEEAFLDNCYHRFHQQVRDPFDFAQTH